MAIRFIPSSFVKKYTDEQAKRMNDLIDQALQMRADIAAGIRLPTDDDAFIVYRGQCTAVGLQHGCLELHASTQEATKERWKH